MIAKSTVDISYTTTSTTSSSSSNSTTSDTSTASATTSSGGRSIVYTKLPVNHLNVTVKFYL